MLVDGWWINGDTVVGGWGTVDALTNPYFGLCFSALCRRERHPQQRRRRLLHGHDIVDRESSSDKRCEWRGVVGGDGVSV